MTARSESLYQRTLGQAWDRLAPPIRQLHTLAGESTFTGECSVDRGGHPLAWLIALAIGFPGPGATQEISVRLIQEGAGERWIRRIGTRQFSSFQEAGRGRHRSLIRERFGPVAVLLALVVDGEHLRYEIRKWTLLGIPLPLAMGPRTIATESVHMGRFRFDVQISHPLTGLIVHYRGTLSPARRSDVSFAGFPAQ